VTTRRRPSGIEGIRRGAGMVSARPGATAERSPALAEVPIRPEKPVRITLDLSPAVHRALRDFAADTGPGVSAAETLRAMIAVTVADKGVSAEVREQIRQARA
jgi:hypothetical protein